ncbi:protein WEAK CHLOROPLAST MOVEMENT UNDER BLUE LIGHT 1-like isoform X1 [Zingiber officinale]|uniref:protein WEAK CHLOROPLAST MOVEMENT UNDER BLUE LIGHT 1-like isoform X1 n=2 Tax=Zingiber officinale TaxID=94328 RepID=UPI001C4D4D5B|nr:protein WEAK CHLOROPLAST MOVEMENT UNDER BLUE LIGHT 1-like isoform X1 [Zingiber officinale]
MKQGATSINCVSIYLLQRSIICLLLSFLTKKLLNGYSNFPQMEESKFIEERTDPTNSFFSMEGCSPEDISLFVMGQQDNEILPLDELKGVEVPKPSDGVLKNLKEDDMKRSFIDTATPFESVKQAVSKFGGTVDWKAQKELIIEKRKHAQLELKKVHEKIPVYKAQCEVAEAFKEQVLKELDSAKRLVEELTLGLEKAETQEAEAKQDSELADLQLKEMEQGIANSASVVTKTHLEVSKERCASAVAELKLVKEELHSTKREYDSLVQERDIIVTKADDSVSASREIEKAVEDLTLELIMIKKYLESAHSAHLEAEEQRIAAALALDQDRLNWEKQLKQAVGELQHLNEKLLLTQDLESKLDRASTLFVSLKDELSSYQEAQRNLGTKTTQEQMLAYWEGDLQEIETNTQEALASTTKELEEVRSHIETAKNEVNCLKLAVSSLENDLEKEKTTLATMKQRENLSSISVSSLEAELNRVHAELELIMNKDEDSREKMVDLPRALQQAAEEADHAKLVANLMREELKKAKYEAEQANVAANTMEKRLNAIMKEIEASKASEKLAKSALEALEESERANLESDNSANGVTLPIEEYYTLSKNTYEAEEIAYNRVISAFEQIKAAKESELKSLVKLEETKKMIKKKKIFQIAAMGKPEMANEEKLHAEQELQTMRAELEQRRKVSNDAMGLSDPEGAIGEIDAAYESSSGSPRPYIPQSNTTIALRNSKRRRSFLPRLVTFLTRKEVQTPKS